MLGEGLAITKEVKYRKFNFFSVAATNFNPFD